MHYQPLTRKYGSVVYTGLAVGCKNDLDVIVFGLHERLLYFFLTVSSRLYLSLVLGNVNVTLLNKQAK